MCSSDLWLRPDGKTQVTVEYAQGRPVHISTVLISTQHAPEVVQRVWGKARELGYEKYFQPDMRTYPITDDHYPLLAAGLRVIDVIDLDYDAHHTLADDVNRVSAASLKVVGDVAVSLVR